LIDANFDINGNAAFSAASDPSNELAVCRVRERERERERGRRPLVHRQKLPVAFDDGTFIRDDSHLLRGRTGAILFTAAATVRSRALRARHDSRK